MTCLWWLSWVLGQWVRWHLIENYLDLYLWCTQITTVRHLSITCNVLRVPFRSGACFKFRFPVPTVQPSKQAWLWRMNTATDVFLLLVGKETVLQVEARAPVWHWFPSSLRVILQANISLLSSFLLLSSPRKWIVNNRQKPWYTGTKRGKLGAAVSLPARINHTDSLTWSCPSKLL